MARRHRIHYPEAIYHVIVRGNNKEAVFQDDSQKNKYTDIIGRYKKEFDFNILAFCIMDNHAHILIKVKETPLSQIMQRIQQVYTQWFNWNYNRSGHVFQQRYKALLCTNDSYLLQLVKYIHTNPVKANVSDGMGYKWSSHSCYISGKEDSFVDTGFVLSMFSSRQDQGINEYFKFMNQPQEEIKYLDIENISERISEQGREKLKEKDIDKIIKDISKSEGVEIYVIISKTKIQKISDIRKSIVLLSNKYSNIHKKEIANKLNLPHSMVSKILSGNSCHKVYIKDIIKRWEETNKI